MKEMFYNRIIGIDRYDIFVPFNRQDITCIEKKKKNCIHHMIKFAQKIFLQIQYYTLMFVIDIDIYRMKICVSGNVKYSNRFACGNNNNKWN